MEDAIRYLGRQRTYQSVKDGGQVSGIFGLRRSGCEVSNDLDIESPPSTQDRPFFQKIEVLKNPLPEALGGRSIDEVRRWGVGSNGLHPTTARVTVRTRTSKRTLR